MKFAEKLTILRRRRGWSQEELAAQIGVSRQAVSKWESGQSMPDLDKILILSDLFEVSTDTLLKSDRQLAPSKAIDSWLLLHLKIWNPMKGIRKTVLEKRP